MPEPVHARSRKQAAEIIRGGPDGDPPPRPCIYRGALLKPPDEGQLTWEAAFKLIAERCPPAKTGRPRNVERGTKVQAWVDESTFEALRRAADEAGRTVSEETRLALEERYGR